MNMKRTVPGWGDPISEHWDPQEVISKPMWTRKGLDNQIHVWGFNPSKGQRLFTPQAKRDFISHRQKFCYREGR